ncbi:hypothetical protein KYK29_04940 [Shinella daejeonensis]|uniref:hypothetical protein n=1 Tax=Shinella daejeonensis TaxID=659017 RepID=UPI0020C7DF29|nr:hypothetical protein [Shinella daejeonensis]MCP8894266.1 hypothetical protein [Shinella daejeonensis]
MPNTSIQADGGAMPAASANDEALYTKDNFPIPYAGIMPTDDLFAARAFLRVVQGAIERACGNRHGMSKDEANDMLHVVGTVGDALETLQRLLDDSEIPSMHHEYARIRRERLVEASEVAQ